MVRKRVVKASRKNVVGKAPATAAINQEQEDAAVASSESEDTGYITGKMIDGVEHMEMINWGEYEETYFSKIKRTHRKFILDKLLKEYKHVDVFDLARELAAEKVHVSSSSAKVPSGESSNQHSYRVLLKREGKDGKDAFLMTFSAETA